MPSITTPIENDSMYVQGQSTVNAHRMLIFEPFQPIFTSQEASHLSRSPSGPPYIRRDSRNFPRSKEILGRSQGPPRQALVQLDHPPGTAQA